MQRFLVIQTAFLGDVILATPVISELKRLYPEAEIDVLVRKGNESFSVPPVSRLSAAGPNSSHSRTLATETVHPFALCDVLSHKIWNRCTCNREDHYTNKKG